MCKKKKSPRLLEIHHIFRWADSPELRFNDKNLITLCKRCHFAIRGREYLFAPLFLEIINGRKK